MVVFVLRKRFNFPQWKFIHKDNPLHNIVKKSLWTNFKVCVHYAEVQREIQHAVKFYRTPNVLLFDLLSPHTAQVYVKIS